MKHRNYNWELPSRGELEAIIEDYAEHKEQWQEKVRKRFAEKEGVSVNHVAEEQAAYEQL